MIPRNRYLLEIRNSMHSRIYLGIDPGASGGMAWIQVQEAVPDKVWAFPMPDTLGDIWDAILEVCGPVALGPVPVIHSVIEQQTPRPTRYRDKATGMQVSTVLASTVTLYGGYMALRAFLTAAIIPYEDTPPKRWQAAMKVPSKAKGESTSHWKGRLRDRAQQLFPGVRVTLPVADALLMAEYCRRVHLGCLER